MLLDFVPTFLGFRGPLSGRLPGEEKTVLRNCYLLESGVFGPDYELRRREGSLNGFISKDLVGSTNLVVVSFTKTSARGAVSKSAWLTR